MKFRNLLFSLELWHSRKRSRQARESVRFTFEMLGRVLNVQLPVNYGDNDWRLFQGGIGTRNDITHPRELAKLNISSEQILNFHKGLLWFVRVSNDIRQVMAKIILSTFI